MNPTHEVRLPGGFVNSVVRIGETVRRPRADGFVRDVLRHLGSHGWSGAPRYLGIDEQDREILSYVDGFVPWAWPHAPAVRTVHAIERAARLLREFHDLTAGTPLAGEHELVCHNDPSPKNTVYRDLGEGLVPVAFIDWDIVAPGERIHDIAHLCWQFVGLGIDNGDWPDLLAAACDGYGRFDRTRLVETVLWWQDRCWRGIESAAAAGDPAMTRLRELDVPAEIGAAYDWVRRHRAQLERVVLR